MKKLPRLETLRQKRARVYDLADLYTEVYFAEQGVRECLEASRACGRCEFCQAARIGSTRNSFLVSLESKERRW